MRVFTDEEDEYLRELTLSDHTYKEMMRLHNERFPDHQITIPQCKAWRSRHHCFSKLTGRFEKATFRPIKALTRRLLAGWPKLSSKRVTCHTIINRSAR